MIYTITCPCGCGHTFQFEVKRATTPESEQRRRDNINRIRAENPSHGRPFGSKDSKKRRTRCDKGRKRLYYRRKPKDGTEANEE